MQISKSETITTFNLTINEAEARFLRDVVGQIGGCPANSRRSIADELSATLDSVGVRHEYVADISESRSNGRGVYFMSV